MGGGGGVGHAEDMSVVKINAIQIPEGMGPQLEARFAGRAKMVEQFEGFEDFQLLRPVEGEDRYFVYTRWASEEAFQVWLGSQEFGKGHGGGGPAGAGHPVVPRAVRRARPRSRSPRAPRCSASKSSNTSSRAPDRPAPTPADRSSIHVCDKIFAPPVTFFLSQTWMRRGEVGR